jgi:hypothetical protein
MKLKIGSIFLSTILAVITVGNIFADTGRYIDVLVVYTQQEALITSMQLLH